jgi:P27 family predicted phage terminase small subunit
MNEKVREIYEMIIEEVSQLDRVRDTDKETIKNLAFNIHTVRQCECILSNEGVIIEGLHGKKEHPAVSVKTKSEAQIRNGYILLGIDFASQLKKKMIDKDENDWNDFL